MTGLNPNAIYELGISHTIGRPAIMMLQPKKAENGRFPFDISYSPRWMSETVQLQRQDSLENHRNILVNEFVEALDLASKQLIPVSLFSIGSYSSSFKRCRNHLASSSTTSGRI
jgi:hypothetical protein